MFSFFEGELWKTAAGGWRGVVGNCRGVEGVKRMLQSVMDWVDPNQRVPVVRNEKGYENKYGYNPNHVEPRALLQRRL